ncbi:universal stress protein [Natrarchaeobius chitinivorans]|uniref:Universal stress protein n=1 Tax=Natrarchaeobius chitinivorans TaxID=1679083 RepID=A0A3N6LYN9_NATCH|nr:universal stress protein [Natrarchaeobius chitinivorans]RQG94217.1 universal stress protein [Natrarchaeobius chitinivorans]
MADILLAVDTDETRATRQVETILDLSFDSPAVTILHTFTENPSGASVNQVKSARLVESRLEEAGIDVTLAEQSGDPAEQIIAFARENEMDAICLAGRKRSPAGKALFGSVTQEVILNTDLPVLIAGKNQSEQL